MNLESKKITKHNLDEFNPSGIDGRPVKIGFFNRLLADFLTVYDYFIAHIPSAGTVKSDTISEYTSGSGVTADGVLLKDNAVNVDTISEKTAGSGVTIDSLLIKDGVVGAVNAITANSTGGGLAIISAVQQFVVITYTNTDHIVSLPLLASFPTGGMIRGTPLNTGGELRVHPTNQVAGVTINNVTGGNELKVNNGTGCAYFEAVKKSATKWLVKTWSSAGAPTTITPDK
jgi:hypothetical protein